MRNVVVFGILLLVALVSAGEHFGRHDHHKPEKLHKQCHFQTEKGSYDLRLLMR